MNYLVSKRLLIGFLLMGILRLSAVEPACERISINADWRFPKDDPAQVAVSLDYSKIREWVLPSRAAFLKDPTVVPKRPEGNLGANVPYAQPGFDDSAWRKLDRAREGISTTPSAGLGPAISGLAHGCH